MELKGGGIGKESDGESKALKYIMSAQVEDTRICIENC
jgi:hypothetical protein